VLLDVTDVALGHSAKQRWNPTDKWVFSTSSYHPAIVDKETFDLVQTKIASK
jgi:hypothetical protein